MTTENSYKTQKVNGKKQFVINGEPAPDDLFQIRIMNALGENFTPNMTRSMTFEDKILNLDENDVIAKEANLALQTYGSLKALNQITEQLGNDITKTNGEKLLLKSQISEKHFQTFDNIVSRLDLGIRKELDNERKELFSNNLMLTVQEDRLINEYARIFKDKDINTLIDGTESEARIALVLARDFPSLIKVHGDYEKLAHEANHIHSQEHAIRFDNLGHLHEELINLSKTVSYDKNKFLSPDLVEEVRSVKIQVPKRRRR